MGYKIRWRSHEVELITQPSYFDKSLAICNAAPANSGKLAEFIPGSICVRPQVGADDETWIKKRFFNF